MEFSTDVRLWKPSLVPADSHHLKQAEHHLNHMEEGGGTNTHEALRIALQSNEVDTIYFLSDGFDLFFFFDCVF